MCPHVYGQSFKVSQSPAKYWHTQKNMSYILCNSPLSPILTDPMINQKIHKMKEEHKYGNR